MEITKSDYELIIKCISHRMSELIDALLYTKFESDADKEEVEKHYDKVSNLFQQFLIHSNESTITINIKR